MTPSLQQLQRAIGYRFRDEELIRAALTHSSRGSRNNERLEFLGDAVLGFVVAEQLFSEYGDSTEGELTRLRAERVNGETLAILARSISLGEYLILGSSVSRTGGQAQASILADALEALFAAIYLDGGLDEVRGVILKLLKQHEGAFSEKGPQKDPKTRLQEYLQARALALPVYEMVSAVGEAHQRCFVVTCSVEALSLSTEGEGLSRKKAEQAAAARLLEQLL